MKAIILHTPMPDNSGARRDAGETIGIGEAADEITPELAQTLVAAGSAIESKTAARKGKIVPDAASEQAE